MGAAIETGFPFGFAGATGFFLGFSTGFVGATGVAFVFDTDLVRTTGFVFVLDTDFVGTTRLVVLFSTAFLGTGRFAFTARFIGATNFVFGFGFAPLAGLADPTGLTFVFVARLFGRGAATDFRCAGTGYHTSVECALIAAVSSSIVISPST